MTGENGAKSISFEAQDVLGPPSGQVLPLMDGGSGLVRTAGYLAAQRTPLALFTRADVIAALSTLRPLLPGHAHRRTRRANSGATTPPAHLQPGDRIRTHIKVTEMSTAGAGPERGPIRSGRTEASRHTDPGIRRKTMRQRDAAAAVRQSVATSMTRRAIPQL